MEKIQIPNTLKNILLGKNTSRQNKLWLITAWKHFENWYIDYKWAGEPMKSRMLFKFSPEDKWIEAKSFEEDLFPTYKFAKDK